MAAKLQCEICGGKLIGKPGGVFECEFCGTEYSTEWAKAKIQEIKGTVQVEGTVEVKGTVQVDNSANLSNLLSRMKIAIHDGQWSEAVKFSEEALNVDAQCYEAYLGKLLCRYRVKNLDDLAELAADFEDDLNYQNAVRVADGQPKDLLERSMCAAKARLAEQNARAEKEKLAAEKSAQEAREKRIPLLAARCAEVAPAKRFLRFYRGDPFVLTEAGNMRPLTKGLTTFKFAEAVQNWKDIRKFEIIHNSVLILDSYGNVTLMRYEEHKVDYTRTEIKFRREEIVSDNTGIDICVYLDFAYVLLENGTLLRYKVTNRIGNNWDTLYKREEDVARFSNIRSMFVNNSGVFCVCQDGSKKEITSSGEVKALPEDDAFLLSNRDICIDGTVPQRKFGVKADPDWDHVIDIVRINNGSFGLMQNGAVLRYTERTAKSEEVWQNVAAIMTGGVTNSNIYAITNDGHILSTKTGEKLLITTPLFESLEALQKAELYQTSEKKRIAQETQERLRRQNAIKKKLHAEKSALNAELSNLKGLFSGKRRKEIEDRLAEIERELKELS